MSELTRITVWAEGGRAAELARALAAAGFTVRVVHRRFVAESSAVAACEARRYLRALGFGDGEVEVSVERIPEWSAP